MLSITLTFRGYEHGYVFNKNERGYTIKIMIKNVDES